MRPPHRLGGLHPAAECHRRAGDLVAAGAIRGGSPVGMMFAGPGSGGRPTAGAGLRARRGAPVARCRTDVNACRTRDEIRWATTHRRNRSTVLVNSADIRRGGRRNFTRFRPSFLWRPLLAPPPVRSPTIATGSRNTFMCLVRFALANIRRRPERFVLSVLGIALAIACVTVVRTISASFAITGADSVTDVLGGANCGRCPPRVCTYDADAQALDRQRSRSGFRGAAGLDRYPHAVGSHRDRRQAGVAAGKRRITQWPSGIGRSACRAARA